MRVLLVHPGASWSTADVFDGLNYGLQEHGVQVVPYRLDQRIPFAHRWVHGMWRQKRKDNPELEKPQTVDVMYHAAVGALEMALRRKVDVVLIVSAMLFHPDVAVMMRQAGLRVVVLFTESPYDEDQEVNFAKLVDGCWTNERSCVAKFREVNKCSGYLPHAWHPLKHYATERQVAEVPAHDVVFVGSGFPDRIRFFNSIDWTGIDLGLYGVWKDLGLNPQVKACVRGAEVSNMTAAALYRRAKIGLNLYRKSKTFHRRTPQIVHAESLSPRAYELAQCGVFHLSDNRAEVGEKFGELVPTFSSPTEAAALIRLWLNNPEGRSDIARQLPACVAVDSWSQRAASVIGDLQNLLSSKAA